jgi:long-chain fatty acid transport protein
MKRLLLASILAMTTQSFAGGMVLPIRGVRTLERGGALVAGADDADALWLDPAGLAHLAGAGKRAFLFDVAYVYQAVDYTRIDSGGTTQPTVSNQQPGMPIPTIAGALGINDKLVIAGGIAAPYAGLHRYDDTGPQRYASISLAGSTFVIVTIGAAYAVSPQLRIGATLQDTVSSLHARVMLSGCPGQTVCAPEDPDFDALTQISQTDFISPSGSVGVQYDATPSVTLGAMFQAPGRVSSTGTLDTKLPRSSLFNGAMVVGDKVSMSFTLPPIVRAGVELHSGSLRVEAAIDIELWSMHDAITIEPDHVRIENVPGVGTYTIGPMSIPRHYKTSVAPSLGAEYHVGSATFGAGASY